MRIGMVAWSFYPRIGGSVTTVTQLSERLLEKGLAVDIIAPLLKIDLDKIEGLRIDKRVKIHWLVSSCAKSYTDFYSRLLFISKMIWKIRTLSGDIDIFHAHDFNVSLISTIIGTLGKKKPIVSVFGADPLFEMLYYKKKACIDYDIFLKNKIIRGLQKIISIFLSIFAHNKIIIVSLSKSLNQVIRKYCSAPIVNIHVGIDINFYYKEGVSKNKENYAILFVARFMSWKGMDIAVEVLKGLKKIKGDFKLICIGDGPLKEHYLEKYGNIDGIYFIAGLDYKDIIDYYRKAALLLITSQYETFGITVLEAMASGLPVVASDLIVFQDRIINDSTGYLVKDKNVDKFCKRIMRLIEDPKKRAEIVNNALEKVKEYDINKISDEYLKLYHRLLIQKCKL